MIKMFLTLTLRLQARLYAFLSFLILVLLFSACAETEPTQPNIIIIYADDMGYGDLNCQNPNSKTYYLDMVLSLVLDHPICVSAVQQPRSKSGDR